MKGVGELIRLEPVEYSGAHTGGLYRRRQVESLMKLSARRACAQSVAWIAEAIEECIGDDEQIAREAVVALAGLVRAEYSDMLERLDLAAEIDPRLTADGSPLTELPTSANTPAKAGRGRSIGPAPQAGGRDLPTAHRSRLTAHGVSHGR